eukprot:632027-Prymnesium_polylepis.1
MQPLTRCSRLHWRSTKTPRSCRLCAAGRRPPLLLCFDARVAAYQPADGAFIPALGSKPLVTRNAHHKCPQPYHGDAGDVEQLQVEQARGVRAAVQALPSVPKQATRASSFSNHQRQDDRCDAVGVEARELSEALPIDPQKGRVVDQLNDPYHAHHCEAGASLQVRKQRVKHWTKAETEG